MNELVCDYIRDSADAVTKVILSRARKGQINALSLAGKEDWRASVAEVLDSLASYLETRNEPDLLYPDAGLSPLLSQKVRAMHGFSAPPGRADLIFAKYYRDAVLEHLTKISLKKDELENLNRMVLNFFDKFELSFGDVSNQPIILREVVKIESFKRQLDETERRLKTVMETIPVAAVVLDKKGKIRSLNQEAARLFDLDFEDAVGRSCQEAIQSSLCGDECFLKKTFTTGGFFTDKSATIKKKGGVKISLVASGACLKDYTGQLIGGIEIFNSQGDENSGKKLYSLEDEAFQKAVKKIERLSVTDEATELYTRDYFRDRLDKEIKRAARLHHSLSVVLIEADHFELYHRLHGKEDADILLKIIGGLLNFSVRSIDVVARHGPKQFALILLECKKKNAEEIANRICAGIAAYKFAGQEKLPLGKLTVSLGVASYPDDAKTRLSLLNNAYEHLCLAISRGGNQVVS